MLEFDLFEKNNLIIACDEVGRGPIAGPVNACSVYATFDPDFIGVLIELGVSDSKKLTSKKRLKILEKLNIDVSTIQIGKIYNLENFQFVVCEYDNNLIDKINILQASLLSMRDGVERIINQNKASKGLILIDGNKAFNWSDNFCKNNDVAAYELAPIVKGDSRSLLIGLASIIAKEYRDQLMKNFDTIYPGYGLAQHAGYPTKQHKQAVIDLGITPIHRKTFRGVSEHVQVPKRS